MARGWSELRKSFAPDMKDNQGRVLAAIRAGDFIAPEFTTVTIPHPSEPFVSVTFDVMRAPLRLGKPGDSVYVTVSHRTAQAIADLLGLVMLTPKLSDEIDRVGFQLEPQRWLTTVGAPSSVDDMVADSKSIDKAAGSGPVSRLLTGAWKDWVNARRLVTDKDRGINYGGYTKQAATPKGVPGPKPSVTRTGRNVWQEPGGFHDFDHVDESQKFRAVDQHAFVNMGPEGGAITVARLVDDIGLDPTLWPIVSHEGPVLMRHPWIERCFSLDEGGSCPSAPSGPVEPGGRLPGGGVPPTTPSAGAGPTRAKRLVAAGGVVALGAGVVYAAIRWL